MLLCADKRRVALTIIREIEGGGQPEGWRRFKSTYREMDAFYNPKLGWVLKKSKLILDFRTPLHLRVPTFKLENEWVLQPLVKKINLKLAVEAIKKELEKYPRIKPDLHIGNVGWYENKPLMFDW